MPIGKHWPGIDPTKIQDPRIQRAFVALDNWNQHVEAQLAAITAGSTVTGVSSVDADNGTPRTGAISLISTAGVSVSDLGGGDFSFAIDETQISHDSIAGSAASTIHDHGLLSGLVDDDHLQYFRHDGTRAMTGQFGTNVGTMGSFVVSGASARAWDFNTTALWSGTAGELFRVQDQGTARFGFDTNVPFGPGLFWISDSGLPLTHDSNIFEITSTVDNANIPSGAFNNIIGADIDLTLNGTSTELLHGHQMTGQRIQFLFEPTETAKIIGNDIITGQDFTVTLGKDAAKPGGPTHVVVGQEIAIDTNADLAFAFGTLFGQRITFGIDAGSVKPQNISAIRINPILPSNATSTVRAISTENTASFGQTASGHTKAKSPAACTLATSATDAAHLKFIDNRTDQSTLEVGDLFMANTGDSLFFQTTTLGLVDLVAGGGGDADQAKYIKAFVPTADVLTVPTKNQIVVCDEYILEGTAELALEGTALLHILQATA